MNDPKCTSLDRFHARMEALRIIREAVSLAKRELDKTGLSQYRVKRLLGTYYQSFWRKN